MEGEGMSDRIGKFWFVTAVNWFGYHVSCVCVYTHTHTYTYILYGILHM